MQHLYVDYARYSDKEEVSVSLLKTLWCVCGVVTVYLLWLSVWYCARTNIIGDNLFTGRKANISVAFICAMTFNNHWSDQDKKTSYSAIFSCITLKREYSFFPVVGIGSYLNYPRVRQPMMVVPHRLGLSLPRTAGHCQHPPSYSCFSPCPDFFFNSWSVSLTGNASSSHTERIKTRILKGGS